MQALSELQRKLAEKLYTIDKWRIGESATMKYYREYSASQFLDPATLEATQVVLLQQILRHAERHCPFYQRRFAEYGVRSDGVNSIRDLARFPILEKADIQASSGDIVAKSWPASDRIKNYTGGSTGQPLSLWFNTDCKCARVGATLRHNVWAGWRLGDRVAHIWGATIDQPTGNHWKSRARNVLVDRALRFNSGTITEAKLRDFHEALCRFGPRIIHAYAKSAALVARYVKSNQLEVPHPMGVVTSAETLFPEDRQVIEEVFGCPVFNRYGCRECSVIASECELRNGLHVMSEGLVLEIVNQGRLAQPGERGSILITDLRNMAMPLIRYRVGDVGTWATTPCGCGRGLPTLSSIEGRITDFLVGPDGKVCSGPFLSLYLIGKCPSVGQAQILQDLPGELTLRVTQQPSEEHVQFIKSTCVESLGEGTIVDFEVVTEIPRGPSGKLILSKSTVPTGFTTQAT